MRYQEKKLFSAPKDGCELLRAATSDQLQRKTETVEKGNADENID